MSLVNNIFVLKKQSSILNLIKISRNKLMLQSKFFLFYLWLNIFYYFFLMKAAIRFLKKKNSSNTFVQKFFLFPELINIELDIIKSSNFKDNL